MLLRKLVVVGLVGLLSSALNVATAEDAVGPVPSYALDNVSFVDAFGQDRQTAAFAKLDVALSEPAGPRFSHFGDTNLTNSVESTGSPTQRYEVSLTAHQGTAGLPVDVSISQRASIGVNSNGDINRQGRGSELRLGRGLSRLHHGPRSTWTSPAWYIFAASDDEAVTWAPGDDNGHRGGFALEDRVEIGDMQAGVTYERGAFQASLAYVERKVTSHAGSQSWSQDESFTGITLTLRH